MTRDLHGMSFLHPSQSDALFEDLNVGFGRGRSGIVGPNGRGQTTLLLIAAGKLSPTRSEEAARLRLWRPGGYHPQRFQYVFALART
jgi:ATPase subunit of ABC transporter with duplicated ATPase domains